MNNFHDQAGAIISIRCKEHVFKNVHVAECYMTTLLQHNKIAAPDNMILLENPLA